MNLYKVDAANKWFWATFSVTAPDDATAREMVKAQLASRAWQEAEDIEYKDSLVPYESALEAWKDAGYGREPIEPKRSDTVYSIYGMETIEKDTSLPQCCELHDGGSNG
jgi:hypothetical protein